MNIQIGRRDQLLLAAILSVGFLLRLYIINADPFLHTWDECYHALVARNMMSHPLKPMLYAHPLLPFDYTCWVRNEVWLHKQPLFLWQMALSMRWFGVSEWAMRLPSALMDTALIALVYRICLLLTQNKNTALLAGALLALSYCHLSFVSGREGTDHNDIAFCFYTLASIWSYCEYLNQPRKRWVVLAGLLSGGAVLVKWLAGLVVFGSWGAIAGYATVQQRKVRPLLPLLTALAISLTVFLPWQWYIWQHYPQEARYEAAFNLRHITEVIESHSGDADFYYLLFPTYFGNLTWWAIIPGILLTLFQLVRRQQSKVAMTLLLTTASFYVFYALIAQTKMIGYLLVLTPIGCVYLAIFASHITQLLSKFRYAVLLPYAFIALCL
ncbi:MAG: phospholipid carrier-dependent glycosyltransferase [Chitinophagia bacterium]|nr:phospholipid carrier-dependent glycosyltransferase [Chitinophagia bacterium]